MALPDCAHVAGCALYRHQISCTNLQALKDQVLEYIEGRFFARKPNHCERKSQPLREEIPPTPALENLHRHEVEGILEASGGASWDASWVILKTS